MFTPAPGIRLGTSFDVPFEVGQGGTQVLTESPCGIEHDSLATSRFIAQEVVDCVSVDAALVGNLVYGLVNGLESFSQPRPE